MVKNSIHLIILFASIVCFSNCTQSQPEQKAAPVTEMTSAESSIDIEIASLASTQDVVCNMSLNDGIADTAQYGEKLFGFCSSGCKDDFLKEPAKYANINE